MVKTPFRRMVSRVERDIFLLRKRMSNSLNGGTTDNPGKRVIFITGVQRSGTNMMIDVLERSYETDICNENDDRAFDNFVLKPRTVLREVVRASSYPYVVFKPLCDLDQVKALLNEFEPARCVWIVRDYRDVVNSMLVSFRNHARQIRRLARDRSDGGWRGRGMSDETQELIRSVAHEAIDDASAAALMWYLRNVLFFEQGLDSDPRVLAIGYEKLVTEPQSQFGRILDFLDIQYTPEMTRNIFASSVRRRSPPEIEAPIGEICDGLLARFTSVIDAGARTPAGATAG